MAARRFLILALHSCVITGGSALSAQTVDEYQRRIDRLRPIYDIAEQRAQVADSIARLNAELDTLRVGVLMALVHPERSGLAMTGLEYVHDRLVRPLGVDSVLLGGVALHFADLSRRQVTLVLPDRDVIPLRVWQLRPIVYGRAMLGATHNWLGAQVGSVANAWVELSVLESTTSFDDVHVELQTAPSPFARACWQGEITSCVVALGLTPVNNPLLDWYDADGRRGLLLEMDGVRVRDREASDVCLTRRWDEVCIDVLRGVGERDIPPPLSMAVRRHFLRFALLSGGEGSVSRYIRRSQNASPDELGDVVAFAAGKSLESVIGEWRDLVMAAEPQQTTLTGYRAAVSLFWTALLVAAALRSTRWR